MQIFLSRALKPGVMPVTMKQVAHSWAAASVLTRRTGRAESVDILHQLLAPDSETRLPGAIRREQEGSTFFEGLLLRRSTRQHTFWLETQSHRKLCRLFNSSNNWRYRNIRITSTISSSPSKTVSRRKSRKANESIYQGSLRDASYIEWWESKMKACKKPTTLEVIKRLNYNNLLGVDEGLKNGSLKEGSLNCYLLEAKRKFPYEVLLCRVGEFYETIGFDACILIEYAALNPMGGLRGNTTPKAGCPIVNLRHTLDCVTREGFSVCIVEEVQGPSQARTRKERFIGGHAHPGSPYVYGLAGADIDLEFMEPEPIIGISKSSRGYSFISVLEIMKTYSVEDALTEEAVVAKLRSQRFQRLYLHRSLKDDSSDTVRWGEYGEGGLIWAECNGMQAEWYRNDPVKELLLRVKELYDLEHGEEFRKIISPAGERTRPLYVGTASQIGILSTPGVPSLLRVLLQQDTNGLCVAYLRDLLLNPPPVKVALSIHEACKMMADVKSAVPDFTCVSSAKLVKLIGAKEVNKMEFHRMRCLAEDVLDMHNNQELRPVLEKLLDPVWLATGLPIQHHQLVEDCTYILHVISQVLASDDDPDRMQSRWPYVPEDFFHDMEHKWRGKVKRRLAEEIYKEVDEAAAALSNAILEDFLPVVERTKAMSNGAGYTASRAEICYNRESQSVWLKGKRFQPFVEGGTLGEAEIRRLVPALDMKGKKAGEDWYTTERVEKALERYKNATENGGAAVIQILKGLAETLKVKTNAIVSISAFSIIAKTLFSHVSEGKLRDWVFPKLVRREKSKEDRYEGLNDHIGQAEVGPAKESSSLKLYDLIPYWLDRSREAAVPNTVEMNSMFLLTGPNGGGKSSILRSVCAAALLANCGLMVPARAAVVPHFDAIMLRMVSSDSPADAKSAFQMEMSELRTILVEATGQSLVMADELCKGTEVYKGTFIVASVLEHLDNICCMGILSTHLHGLLDLELKVKRVVRKAMEAKEMNGQLKPTWRLVDGVCRESLAFEMARREGVPEKVIDRAEALLNQLRQKNAELRNGQSSTTVGNWLLDTDGSCDEERITFPPPPVVRSPSHDGAINSPETQACAGLGLVGLLPQAIIAVGEEEGGEDLHSVKKEGDGMVKRALSVSSDVAVTEFRKIEDVVEAFQRTCMRTLSEISSDISDVSCRVVRPRQKPPPNTTKHSCVYMLLRPDGKFYVGQTDNIGGRIATHRKGEALRYAPFVYVTVENKSVACQLETNLIHHLPAFGLTLVNKADQNHRHFGTAASTTYESPPF